MKTPEQLQPKTHIKAKREAAVATVLCSPFEREIHPSLHFIVWPLCVAKSSAVCSKFNFSALSFSMHNITRPPAPGLSGPTALLKFRAFRMWQGVWERAGRPSVPPWRWKFLSQVPPGACWFDPACTCWSHSTMGVFDLGHAAWLPGGSLKSVNLSRKSLWSAILRVVPQGCLVSNLWGAMSQDTREQPFSWTPWHLLLHPYIWQTWTRWQRNSTSANYATLMQRN